jgi:outer membrane beta-barrel protein
MGTERGGSAIEAATRGGRGPMAAAWPLAACAALLLAALPAAARAEAVADSLPAETADSLAGAASARAEVAGADASLRPAANAPLESVRKARLSGRPRTVIRTGPSGADAIAAVLAPGTELVVLARSGDWINVRLSPSEAGWVHVSLCEEFDDLSGAPMRPNPRLYVRTGSYLLAGYAGGYAFDRKSNSLALGGRLSYYVFDRVQVETGAAWTHVNRPAEIVESLFGLSLEAEKFHMLFYHLNVTYEFLPGRQMVPFATAGAGSSIFQGRTETSFNFGAGTTLFLSRRTGMRWEVRDYVFRSGQDQARRTHHNIEFSLGSLLLF